ncbi:MAG: CRISPR-associated helicase Cas3', partial [Candidatus Omnitrophica bacterium]|nr:CRISPR-associated helicase Cas3' [Candidatus Omnitrophota bacterium]
MEYFAHSENEQGEKHSLSGHLQATARIAASFVSDANIKVIFKVAGFLHDLGKYQSEFQRYLKEGGQRGSVPHSFWGAGYARLNKMIEIAFAIDGHHKGIPNRAVLKADTEVFKRNEVSNYDSVIQSFLHDNKIIADDVILGSLTYQGLTQELFIRYLFSALTDADWLDTEGHFDFDKAKYRGGKFLNIAELQRRLEVELANKPKNGDINRLRNEARNLALQKTNLPCGFYSLNLPTGLGKTLISMAWALEHAKRNNLRHILIVLPYINIIDQTASELKRIFGEDCILEHHSGYNDNTETLIEDEYMLSPLDKMKRLACENWNYPVIVTTTVQFFESLFSNKPSKCRKIHNIAESVVIFDEVQSLPKEILLPTLNMLKNINLTMRTSFLFCTATQPAFEKRNDFDGIENICPLIESPIEIFEKTQRVNYFLMHELKPIDYDDLLNGVIGEQQSTLVIFNTKKATLEFHELAKKKQGQWDEHYHLSTLLCPMDRKRIIESIRRDLKEKHKILVSSTQLIEAGVDFDFPCVFRAIAPLEAIIQSAGRCNREGSLANRGRVYLFQLEDSGMPDKTYRACAEHVKSLIQEDLEKLYQHNLFQESYAHVVNLFIDPDNNN